MIPILFTFWKLFSSRFQYTLRQWTRPATAALALSVLTDLSRSRTDLLAENVLLRQQLIVLNRQVKRPALTTSDRIHLGLLARCTRYWRQALLTPSSTACSAHATVPTGLGRATGHFTSLAARTLPALLAA